MTRSNHEDDTPPQWSGASYQSRRTSDVHNPNYRVGLAMSILYLVDLIKALLVALIILGCTSSIHTSDRETIMG